MAEFHVPQGNEIKRRRRLEKNREVQITFPLSTSESLLLVWQPGSLLPQQTHAQAPPTSTTTQVILSYTLYLRVLITAFAADNFTGPTLDPSLCYGHFSPTPTPTPTLEYPLVVHMCCPATVPQVQELTVEYIYPDLTRRMRSVRAEVVTVCDVLACAEDLMVINLDHDTGNNPYGSTMNRRIVERPPCQRRVTYFDHLRKLYGEAGLLKSESGEEVWELRFGCKSDNFSH